MGAGWRKERILSRPTPQTWSAAEVKDMERIETYKKKGGSESEGQGGGGARIGKDRVANRAPRDPNDCTRLS